jgi:putrescine transport system substrate-binding protein
MLKRVATTGLLMLGLLHLAPTTAQETLRIYNWSDYIAADTLANFQQQTGIRVVYDLYDSNEMLEAKMLAGRSGYDLVFPSARPFAERLMKAKLYQPIDSHSLSGWQQLDGEILASLQDMDPGNQFLLPYMWGTTGLAYNRDKVAAILGDDMPGDSWRLVFDPAIASRLAGCGIALMDDALEVLVAAQAYLGMGRADYSQQALQQAAAVVAAVRPQVRYFHNSQTINDLANGDLCVAHGYSGDMLQAQSRAQEAGQGVHIEYVVPREGAVVWTDVAAIPVDAPNPKAAKQFLSYLLQPQVIADISNSVQYANANLAATALLDEQIRHHAGIYPPAATRQRLITLPLPEDKQTRLMSRTWTRIKSGK